MCFYKFSTVAIGAQVEVSMEKYITYYCVSNLSAKFNREIN